MTHSASFCYRTAPAGHEALAAVAGLPGALSRKLIKAGGNEDYGGKK
jgi:hypothetical protein